MTENMKELWDHLKEALKFGENIRVISNIIHQNKSPEVLKLKVIFKNMENGWKL